MIRFAQIFLNSNQRMKFDDAVEALSLHAVKFDYANTPLLTEAAVADIFQKVNALFSYNEKVIVKQPLEIMRIDAQYESCNGESAVHFGSQVMAGSICMYQMQDVCTGTPEHILLHELGHLAHMKVTGTQNVCRNWEQMAAGCPRSSNGEFLQIRLCWQ